MNESLSSPCLRPEARPSTPPPRPLQDVTNISRSTQRPSVSFDTPRHRKTPTVPRPAAKPWPRFGQRIPMLSINAVTKKIFGYEPRRWQQQLFQKMAEGYDTFAIAGTGYGKSLIFPMAAIAAELSKKKGTMLVICPLKSLEEDQVLRFNMAEPVHLADGSTVKITAVVVNEDNKEKSVFTQLEAGTFRLCYASPECLLRSQDFKQLFRKESFRDRLVAIAVDEAHLIETWKDSFRKDFADLEVLKIIAGTAIPWVALTATASTRTFEVIYTSLGMGGSRSFWGIDMGSNRPNLALWVRPMEYSLASQADLFAFVPQNPRNAEDFEKMLFYFKTRRQARRALDRCRALVPAEFSECLQLFIATGSNVYKKKTTDELRTNGARWVFATIALGLGLDIPDITKVVVYGVTALGDAFQEGGRAGRDTQLKAQWIWLVEPWAFDPTNEERSAATQADGKLSKKMQEEDDKRTKMDQPARTYINYSNLDSCMRVFLCDHFRPKPNLPGFKWYTGDPQDSSEVDVEWVVEPQEIQTGPGCGCVARCCRQNPDLQPALLTDVDHQRIQHHWSRLFGPPPVTMSAYSSKPQVRCTQAEREILKEKLHQWRVQQWKEMEDSCPFLSPQWVISDSSIDRATDKANVFLNAEVIDEGLLSGIVKWIPDDRKTASLLTVLQDFRDTRRARDQRAAAEHLPKRRQVDGGDIFQTPSSQPAAAAAFMGQLQLSTPAPRKRRQPAETFTPLGPQGSQQPSWRVQGYKH